MTHAMADAQAALEVQARETAWAIIEERARDYALRPRELDAIEPGLSKLTARQLRKRLAVLIGEEISRPRRIMEVEVIMVNLKASMVYAEWMIEIVDTKRKMKNRRFDSEMVVDVAAAILKKGQTSDVFDLAVVALAATREATPRMISAGDKEVQQPGATALSVFQAMIDEALTTELDGP